MKTCTVNMMTLSCIEQLRNDGEKICTQKINIQVCLFGNLCVYNSHSLSKCFASSLLHRSYFESQSSRTKERDKLYRTMYADQQFTLVSHWTYDLS